MYRGIGQPRRLGTVTPFREGFAQARIPELLLALVVPFLLHRQSLVEYETDRSREAAHVALLFAIGHEFELVGFELFHGL